MVSQNSNFSVAFEEGVLKYGANIETVQMSLSILGFLFGKRMSLETANLLN
jgi:hypothetical protein